MIGVNSLSTYRRIVSAWVLVGVDTVCRFLCSQLVVCLANVQLGTHGGGPRSLFWTTLIECVSFHFVRDLFTCRCHFFSSFHAQLKFVVGESSAASGTCTMVRGAKPEKRGVLSKKGGMATVGDMVSAHRPLSTSTVFSFVDSLWLQLMLRPLLASNGLLTLFVDWWLVERAYVLVDASVAICGYFSGPHTYCCTAAIPTPRASTYIALANFLIHGDAILRDRKTHCESFDKPTRMYMLAHTTPNLFFSARRAAMTLTAGSSQNLLGSPPPLTPTFSFHVMLVRPFDTMPSTYMA